MLVSERDAQVTHRCVRPAISVLVGPLTAAERSWCTLTGLTRRRAFPCKSDRSHVWGTGRSGVCLEQRG
jgi:hypothetical protein